MNKLYTAKFVNFPEWALNMVRVVAYYSNPDILGSTGIFARNITHWWEEQSDGVYLLNVFVFFDVVNSETEVPSFLNIDVYIVNEKNYVTPIKDRE